MKHQPDDAAPNLAEIMRRIAPTENRTKRSAARLTIVEAIQSGVLEPGDYLPSETALARILGVSLGTVQAALRQLQQVGIIVRRRGDGTRVASTEPLSRDTWHFRFVAKQTGQPLRTHSQRVWIDRIQETGDWSDWFGGGADFIRIRRRVVMQDGTPVGAEMHLVAATVPGLEQVDPKELDMVNIRPYLEERYGLSAVTAKNVVRTIALDKHIAETFDLEADSTVFEVEARTRSADGKPAYFQRIYVSATTCGLSF